MKTIRNLAILVGLSAMLFALTATGARAQALDSTSFRGTFTLPVETQWGAVTLPAGDYSLEYGRISKAGPYLVMIAGKEDGNARGMILAGARSEVTATKNAIFCVRDGGALLVRSLEMSAIGESVHFRLPHGVKLMANQGKHVTNTQIAQAPMLIQRIPVKPGAR